MIIIIYLLFLSSKPGGGGIVERDSQQRVGPGVGGSVRAKGWKKLRGDEERKYRMKAKTGVEDCNLADQRRGGGGREREVIGEGEGRRRGEVRGERGERRGR